MDIKTRFKKAKTPFVIAAFLLGFTLIYWLLGLPTSDQLAKIISDWLAKYGYCVVFAAALIETIPFFDVYFPGSTIIVLAVTLSQQGNLNVSSVLMVAGLGFTIGYIGDYYFGKYGLHRVFVRYGFDPSLENARLKIGKHGVRWLWVAYVHPIIGSVAALSAGTLGIPFRNFILHSIGANIFWVSFWGMIVYFGKHWIIHFILDLKWALAAILVWLAYRFFYPPKRD